MQSSAIQQNAIMVNSGFENAHNWLRGEQDCSGTLQMDQSIK